MKIRSLLAGMFMAIATICVAAFFLAPVVTPDSTPVAFSGENTSEDSDVKFLPTDLPLTTTLVGYNTAGPPPWSNGNCLKLAIGQNSPNIQVANMSTENYFRAVKDFQLEKVKVKMLGDRHCMVIDPRIPKSWLITVPCGQCTPPVIVNLMLQEYANQAKSP